MACPPSAGMRIVDLLQIMWGVGVLHRGRLVGRCRIHTTLNWVAYLDGL